MQTYLWWIPYLFGIVTPHRLQTYQIESQNFYQMFTPRDDYVVPSAEHTILFIYTILALAFTSFFMYDFRIYIVESFNLNPIRNGLILLIPSLTAFAFSFNMVINNLEDQGALIICGMIFVMIFVLHFFIRWPTKVANKPKTD